MKFMKPIKPWKILLISVAILLIFELFSVSFFSNGYTSEYIEYNAFLNMVEKGEVGKVRIGAETITIYPKEKKTVQGTLPWVQDELLYLTYRIDDVKLVDRLLEADVTFAGQQEADSVSILDILISYVLPIAFYGIMLLWIFRLVRGARNSGGGAGGIGTLGFGKSSAKLYNVSDVKTRFTDVAGQEEAKDALLEMVDFLNNPKRYTAVGAKLPKGALLVGPPGTGKTLLAQAVAGESNVPFFFVSGSAFVEMFVGMGASRVRDLFKQAEEKSPCIVFIDEIDAIGKKRDSIGISGNDEREQTLNQLLAEMDGFAPDKGIIVLAATNRPEVLDKALLRPGRFDRRIPVELPDQKGREDILDVHAKGKLFESGVDLKAVAKATPGASGADLANILNEAVLFCVRAYRTRISQADLMAAVEYVIVGSEKNRVITPKEKQLIAYHEVGHAIVAATQKEGAPVRKITIIPRTSGVLGFTMQTDEEEHVLYTREDLENRIAVLTAGRAAEEFAFGTCSTGAANDIERATQLARSMVTRYGMSTDMGLMTLDTVTSPYLDGELRSTCSPTSAAQVESEIRSIISTAYERALSCIRAHAAHLNSLACLLLDRESLTGEEFMEIFTKDVEPSTEKTPG